MKISQRTTYSKQTVYRFLVPRAGLEPARPFGPEDFLTTIAFATYRLLGAQQFVVWTMPSPFSFQFRFAPGKSNPVKNDVRREPSRLYTLLVFNLESQIADLKSSESALARRCHSANAVKVSPNLTPSTPVFPSGALKLLQTAQVLCVCHSTTPARQQRVYGLNSQLARPAISA